MYHVWRCIFSFTFSTLSTRISRADFSYLTISDFRILKRNVAYTYAYTYTVWRRKRRCTTRRKLVSLSESPSIMTNRTNALEIHRSATQLFVSQREDREEETRGHELKIHVRKWEGESGGDRSRKHDENMTAISGC